MSESNPFEPPRESNDPSANEDAQTPADRGPDYASRRVRGPALALLGMSSIWVVLATLALISISLPLLTKPKPTRPATGQVTRQNNAESSVGSIAVGVVVVVVNLVMLLGSASMLKLKNYSNARLACIAACIPFCGFLWILTIPFGIWGLIVLRDPDVRDYFLG